MFLGVGTRRNRKSAGSQTDDRSLVIYLLHTSASNVTPSDSKQKGLKRLCLEKCFYSWRPVLVGRVINSRKRHRAVGLNEHCLIPGVYKGDVEQNENLEAAQEVLIGE